MLHYSILYIVNIKIHEIQHIRICLNKEEWTRGEKKNEDREKIKVSNQNAHWEIANTW